MKIQEYLDQDERYQSLLEKVYRNPYIELKELFANGLVKDVIFYEQAVEKLTQDFILVELTSQAGSTVESRVPKKILIVNPELTEEFEKLFS